MKDYRSEFLKVFSNIPVNLRDSIIAVVDDKPFTWNVSYIEIKNNSEIGRKILNILIQLEII